MAIIAVCLARTVSFEITNHPTNSVQHHIIFFCFHEFFILWCIELYVKISLDTPTTVHKIIRLRLDYNILPVRNTSFLRIHSALFFAMLQCKVWINLVDKNFIKKKKNIFDLVFVRTLYRLHGLRSTRAHNIKRYFSYNSISYQKSCLRITIGSLQSIASENVLSCDNIRCGPTILVCVHCNFKPYFQQSRQRGEDKRK